MAQRIEVGSAEFKMLMELDQFRQQVERQAPEIAARGSAKVAQAVEQGAKTGADALGRETKRGVDAQERELKRGADVAAREAKRAADAQAREAQRAATQTKQALNAGLAIGAGAVGLSLGVSGVVQGIQGIVDATKEAQQAQFALGRAFGANAAEMKQAADSLADSLGGQRAEFERASVATATLTRNYGLSAAQAQNVVKIGADLAAVYGLDVVDATTRVTAAIRGEAEAAEVLGLSLQSDAVKGLAAMTDAQRKNFETLDPVTKAQILYNAVVEQGASATGAAAERAASALGTFDKFGASAKTLGANLGEAVLPEFERLVKHLNDIIVLAPQAAKALQDSFGGPSQADPRLPPEQNELGSRFIAFGNVERFFADQVARLRGRIAPSDIEAALRALPAPTTPKAVTAATEADPATKARLQFQDQLKKELDELDKIEKERIQSNLKTLEEGQRQSIEAINKRKDAAIEAADAERDANLASAAASRDAALQALEQEQTARQRVRLQQDRELEDLRRFEDRGISATREAEDRARERSNAEQLRALEQQRDAAIKNQDAIIDGIDRKRDAALAAIDEERDAEDRRHQEALDNLEREKDARVGEIDAQLRALSDQERSERRAERSRSLREGLGNAQRDLKEARREGDANAIRRARQAVARAEEEIRKEERNNEREDLRQSLNDQKQAILEEIDERKKAEIEKSNAIKAGLDDRKEKAQSAAEEEINQARAAKDAIVQSYSERAEAIKTEQAARTQAIQDQRALEDQQLADRRQAQDRAIQDQRAAEDAAHAASIAAVQASYQQQTRVIAAEYEKQKREAMLAADAEIRETNRKFEAAAQALRRQENNWVLLRNSALIDIDAIGDALIDAVDGNAVRQSFRNLQNQFRAISGIQIGSGTAPMGPHLSELRNAPQQPSSFNTNRSGFTSGGVSSTQSQRLVPGPTDIERYLIRNGFRPGTDEFIRNRDEMWDELHDGSNRTVPPDWGGLPITGMKGGGMIREPSLIYGEHSRRVYARAGENGPEYVTPSDRMGWGGSRGGAFTITINDHRTDVQTPVNWQDMAPHIGRYFADLLVYTQQMMPPIASSDLPGAEMP